MTANSRHRQRSLIALVAVAALTTAAQVPVTPAVAAAKEPSLRFVAAAHSVVITHYQGEPIQLDFGTYLVVLRHDPQSSLQ